MPAHHAADSNSEPFRESVLVDAVTVTATGAIGVPKSGFGQVNTIRAEAVASSVTGTSPSYTIKLQQSQDGQNWYDIGSGAFSAITASGAASSEVSVTGPFDDNIRAFATVTGTTPSAVITVNLATAITDTEN